MTGWPLRVVIGYDSREHEAYVVTRHSLLRHSTIPLFINRLDIHALTMAGLYTRPYRVENGQMIDERDGRPFSTEFAFSRFLVPALALYDGWSVFCDCDFLFTDDIAKLMPLIDNKYACMVVKHNHIPIEETKMDGVSQGAYPRKNWSSFILWNNGHSANRALNLANVNGNSGRSLHGFEWLKDEEIGEIPQTWNWLSGINDDLSEMPKAIHFTLGIPSMPGHENTPYSDLWRDELNLANGVNDMSKGHYSGTNAPSSMRTGPGPSGMKMVKAGGPGPRKGKVTTNMSGTNFGVGSKSSPKGMKISRSGA